ncbi:MAG: DUF3990 domain-containing protein [bacterium]|nr:DUF3990 domain-containing protein [bacterium]
MIVYHGSYIEIPKPDVAHSRVNVDFGRGFYITPLLEQARKWCLKFKVKKGTAVVSEYELDDAAFEKCKVLHFNDYSEEWLEFVMDCRRGNDKTDYEIIIGGVANDKVFNTVELFFDGLIDKTEALKRLKYEKPNLQIAVRTQEVLNKYMHFERSECL